MQCKACGKTSRTSDYCEWCRQPMMSSGSAPPTSGVQPTTQMPAQPNRRVALTGEVIETEVTQAMPPMGVMPPHPGTAYNPPGRTPMSGGPVYPPQQPGGLPAVGVRMPPGSSLPASAYSPLAVHEMAAAEGPSLGERWEKFLAMALPFVALSLLLVHFLPVSLIGVVAANVLILPIMLGATGAIPRYEDAILDCSVMLIVAIFFGPLIALGAYLLTALIKQECNVAIVALLAINILIKLLFGFAFAPSIDTLSLAALWGLFNWTSFFGVCLSFLGWLLSSFFRDIND